ncbi:unnamed protein product [Phaedon cochleariae]|uniref:protein disulfide-isomerase n=1 Tax=Phaedon cochleariae TaxID=80249 RepID=A0A9P0DN37_PHACE|nr:unnamed protein product [Phaedon cochleariae]
MLIISLMFLVTFSTIHHCSALYENNEDVIDLTVDNFQDLVIKSKEMWLVEFYAPWCGHCKNLVPEYVKAAEALRGIAKVGAMHLDLDVQVYRDFGKKYQIQGFPTIKIFGADKNEPEPFEAEKTAKGLAGAVLKAARNKIKAFLEGGSTKPSDVITLTDENFDELVLTTDDTWMVEFYAPWCGHCKNLAPEWTKAATELKGKVKLGAIDATANPEKSEKYGVQGYPTIKYFAAGSKKSPLDYDGGRSSIDIVNWAVEKLAETTPAPNVSQIVDEKSLRAACEDTHLCVLTILPQILDCQSKCRNDYIKLLNAMGEKFKKKKWGWVWSEAGAQPELEKALDIGGYGYPAMVVINYKKLKSTVFKGSFSKEGLQEFFRDLSYGKSPTVAVETQELPRINVIEPWDGEDKKVNSEETDEGDSGWKEEL